MRFSALSHIVLLGAALVAPQTPTLRRSVDAIVLDATGSPVTDLPAEKFSVQEAGEVRTIEQVAPASAPWSVLLLFDHNLTWLQEGGGRRVQAEVNVMYEQLGAGISRFLSSLAPMDRIAIASFENEVELMLDWRNAKTGSPVEIPLNTLLTPPKGEKDVYGAIRWALTKLQMEKGRKAAIIFTDGRDGRLAPQWLINDEKKEVLDPLYGITDTAEASEFIETLDAVSASSVRLYFVAVTSNQPPNFQGRPISTLFPGSKEAVAGYLSRIRSRLETLAESSSGSVLYSPTAEDAIARYQTLDQTLQLGSRYTIEYLSTGRSQNVSVGVSDPALRPFNFKPIQLP